MHGATLLNDPSQTAMDRLVEEGFQCEVSTLKRITDFYPYNCLIDPSSNDQYFNIVVVQNHWLVHRTASVKACSTSHDFFNVPKNSIKLEIDSIFSSFDVPQEFRDHVATKIMDFAGNMANNTQKDKKYLYMRVDFHIAHQGSLNDYEQVVQESMEDDLPLR